MNKHFIFLLLFLSSSKIVFAKTVSVSLPSNKYNFQAVPFAIGMKRGYEYCVRYMGVGRLPEDSHKWRFLKDLYEKNVLKNSVVCNKPLIPKIIHQIWLGSPFPEKLKKWQQSWLEKNPTWQYRLWTDEDLKTFKLQNQKMYEKATNWGEKSDIFRYEILYRYGGLYADIDFECLKPLDILHHTLDFYTGIGYLPHAFLYNGLIAAAPGHPIIKACIEKMAPGGELENTDDIQNRTGPWYFTRRFLEIAPECKGKVVALPVSYIYPITPKENIYTDDPKIIKQLLSPESFFVHYWTVTWVPKDSYLNKKNSYSKKIIVKGK